MSTIIGEAFNQAMAAFSEVMGQTFDWLTAPSEPQTGIACTRKQLERSEMNDFVAGLAADVGNAANADFWIIRCNPLAFNAGAGPFPREGDEVSWDDAGISALKKWRVVDAGNPPVYGSLASIRLLVFREVAPQSAQLQSSGEANPGKRPQFPVPASQIQPS
jgi:hypothetical protein